MHDVDLDLVDVHELAVVRDPLHREQPARDVDGLAHRLDRMAALNSDLRGKRVPPRAEPELDPARGEVVEGREGRGEEPDVARPCVDDARADCDPLRRRCVRGHRNRCLAHEPALSLPDGLEAAFLRHPRVAHAVADGVLVLKVERYSIVNGDGHRRLPSVRTHVARSRRGVARAGRPERALPRPARARPRA